MEMKGILVAFPGEKTRTYITEVLERIGVPVAAVCGTGVETISQARKMKRGILLTGDGLMDMTPQAMRDSLPRGFCMILLARTEELERCQGAVIPLAAPVTEQMLLDAVQGAEVRIMAQTAPVRSREDRELIARAKQLLMTQRDFSEEEAYRYIQKLSMNRGYKMVMTARGILEGQITA